VSGIVRSFQQLGAAGELKAVCSVG
jgi:hypothetical protein